MSQFVTPPDIFNEDPVYLIVNAEEWDLAMVAYWLKFNSKDYTLYLYKDGMEDPDWLKKAAGFSELILVNKANFKDPSTVGVVLDHVSKIKWFGEGQEYPSSAEYLVKNG